MTQIKNNARSWAKAAAIRAVKTMAQVDWKLVASASALAGILSVLTSLAGLPEVEEIDQ